MFLQMIQQKVLGFILIGWCKISSQKLKNVIFLEKKKNFEKNFPKKVDKWKKLLYNTTIKNTKENLNHVFNLLFWKSKIF